MNPSTPSDASRVAGYQPVALTLTGFKGIRSGLCRDTLALDLETLAGDAQLVAITGANGRGKTTVMENLTPYLLMPSRAGADGLGAFSYYDHVYLPESVKELIWDHRGRRYRSQIVVRSNGKRRSEAYLFEAVTANPASWRPVVLADGTPSDGRIESYERAVAEILGPAQTFFTSAFSAQGKRPLSAWRAGEVKTLLADLLGLDEVRAQGAKAADVARQLKGALSATRETQGEAAADVHRLQREAVALSDADTRLDEARLACRRAGERVDVACAELAAVQTLAKQAQADESRRQQLTRQRLQAASEHEATSVRLGEEGARIERRAAALNLRVAARIEHHTRTRQQLLQRCEALRTVTSISERVRLALRRHDLAARVMVLRRAKVGDLQAEIEALEQARDRARACRQDAAALEREAGQLALRQSDLARRFGLANAVPCAGTDLQGRCQLLADARDAQALRPAVDAQLAALVERRAAVRSELQALEPNVVACAAAAQRRNRAEQRLEASQDRLARLERWVGREGEVRQAVAMLSEAQGALADMPANVSDSTEDERAERLAIQEATAQLCRERERQQALRDRALQQIDDAIQQLPAIFDAARVELARQALGEAREAARVAESEQTLAVRRHEQGRSNGVQLDKARQAMTAADSQSRHIEQELATWQLLSKCLSNDGIVALAIDDAGPTLARIANDLLLACYGPRFTIEVLTQSTTAKGELREDFDIVVHDGLCDESKSLKLVSGGERIWINETVTRAIALYLEQGSNRGYATLFSDEADGALDPEHKRMFMAMKREVLRLGGYEREYFVSQTPALSAMADAIIDLDALVVGDPVSRDKANAAE